MKPKSPVPAPAAVCLPEQPEFPELPDLRMCNFSALRMASRRVSQVYDTILAPLGIKTTQLSILAVVAQAGATPLTINALAEMLVMDRSTLGQNLRPLERLGLLRVGTDQLDRRVRRVTLTSLGAERLGEGVAYWHQAQAHFEAHFGADAAALRKTLFRIATNGAFSKP